MSKAEVSSNDKTLDYVNRVTHRAAKAEADVARLTAQRDRLRKAIWWMDGVISSEFGESEKSIEDQWDLEPGDMTD